MATEEERPSSPPPQPSPLRGEGASEGEGRVGKGRSIAFVLLLALASTLLNALKPVHIDDTTYISFAKQVAAHPLDPYGFEVFWAGAPQPANHVLAPPVFLYWIAPAIKIFGESPALWKLWAFPFHVLLAWSCERLLRRFARGLETPLLASIMLSPAVLPGWNLMLDVPALAFALAAIVVFLEACDRDKVSLALLAGLLVGLATETKYTGVTAGAAIVAYGLSVRKPRLALFAGLAGAAFFLLVEGAIHHGYGESHFLANLGNNPQSLRKKIRLLKALPKILGGVLPFLSVLALAGAGVGRWKSLGAGVLSLVGFLVLPFLPCANDDQAEFSAACVFLPLGILVLGTLGLACCQLLRKADAVDRFLVSWLVLEALGCIVLTPFPAVRRVLAFVVAATIVVGRLASRSQEEKTVRLAARVSALGTVLVGLLVWAVDTREAFSQKIIIDRVRREVQEISRLSNRQTWFVGHWGFQYYAEQAGIRPVEPGRSKLKRDDCLLVPDPKIYRQDVDLEPLGWPNEPFSFWWMGMGTMEVDDRIPLTTLRCYYGGKTVLEPHSGPRLQVESGSVLEDHVAEAAPPKERD